MHVKLKGINHVRKWLATEGRWEDYWFAWKGKGAPRLAGKPGSPEFIASYNEAIACRAPAVKDVNEDTLSWLIAKFLNSQHFKGMDAKTQQQYGWIIPSIEKQFGGLPLEALKARRTKGILIDWRDSIAAGTCETLVSRYSGRPRKASASMADMHFEKLAAILSWGVKRGPIEVNPCEDVEKLYHSSRLDKVWSLEQEARFLANARADLVEAYLLAVWTAFREGDCIDLRVAEYDGEFIRRELQKRSRPGKPRKRVMIPVAKPLKPILEAMVRRTGTDRADLETRAETKILRNSKGQPWASEDAFYMAFKRTCDRLGIKDRTFHDLRRTAVVRLAIAGCTEAEIASITGHSIKDVKSVLERHYLYLDPQIAINAMKKLENSTLGVYSQFVRQFLEGSLEASTSATLGRPTVSKLGTPRPTELPTALSRSASVRSKA